MQMRSCRTEHADVPAAPSRRYLATGHLILMLVSVALFGCRNISEPIAPPDTRLKPGRPSYDVYGCSLGTTVCARLDSAITALENGDPDCQGVGIQARSRFNSTNPNIGFKQGDEVPGQLGYVESIPNSNPSNYFTTGITYFNMSQISAAGLNTVSGLENRIAHEEYHQYGYGPYHSQWDQYWQAPGPPPPPCHLVQNWPS